jgi:hypothetical protein
MSEQAKHTPGPWEVTNIPQAVRHSEFSVKAVFGCPGMDDSKLVPAMITFGANAEANAHLIAAAPDLLAIAECQEAIRRWLSTDDSFHWSDCLAVLMGHGFDPELYVTFNDFLDQRRRAAIDKATGKPIP